MCPICSGSGWSVFLEHLRDRQFDMAGEFTVWRCDVCGAWRLWPVPSDLADYYPGDYGPHTSLVSPGAKRPWHKPLWRYSFSENPLVRRVAQSRLRRNEAACEMWTLPVGPPEVDLRLWLRIGEVPELRRAVGGLGLRRGHVGQGREDRSIKRDSLQGGYLLGPTSGRRAI